MAETNVISIKNPWGILIAMGIKDIENRTWKTNIRGRVLIHTSSTIDPRFKNGAHCFTNEQLEAIAKFQLENHSKFGDFGPDDFLKQKGSIIGEFNLVDCVINHDSIWAEKTPEYVTKRANQAGFKPIYNWVIEDAVLYDEPITGVLGKLNFWKYDI